jgi:long-chain fatty acid transport protein
MLKSGSFAVRTIPALIAVSLSGYAGASGFQLMEQNASGLGVAFAGSAAVAEDASTIFWNPAGMAYLPKRKMQVVGVLSAIKPSTRFSNDGSINPVGIYGAAGNGGDAGGWAYVPAMYFALPINDQISLGIGVNAPFGLATEYDKGWTGRFRALNSDVTTMNINPSISFKPNETWAFGVGFSAQKLDGTFSNNVNASNALCSGFGNPGLCSPAGALRNLEGWARIDGDDWGWGYNLGAMFQPSPSTRVGLSYRSSIDFKVTGDVKFWRPTVTTLPPALNAAANAALAGAMYNGNVKSDIELPDTAILSAWQRLSDRWEMMGDISWTGWAKIQDLTFVRTNGPAAGRTLSSTEENWRNTWRVALGAAYQLDDQWKFRAGIAYDQSPVDSSEYRTPRLPDNDRTWLAVGAQYKPSKDLVFDAGYTYIWVKDPSINDSGGMYPTQAANVAAYGWLKGNYSNNVNILAVQATYSF